MAELKLKGLESMEIALNEVLRGEFSAFKTEVMKSAGKEVPADVIVIIVALGLRQELMVDGNDYTTDALRLRMEDIITAIVDGDPSAALEAWEQVSK